MSFPLEKNTDLPCYQPEARPTAFRNRQEPKRSYSKRRWAWASIISTAVIYLLSSWTPRCHHSHVGPLSPTFLTHCSSLLDAPSGTYTNRIARITTSIEPDTIYIAEPGTSSEYFIGGFSSRDWWLSERPLLIALTPSSNNVTILTARFEQSRAELVDLPEEIRDIATFVPWLESESPYQVLKSYLGNESSRVVVDGQVRSFIAEGLEGAGFTRASAEESDTIKEIRERKDEREIGLLRCANQVRILKVLKTDDVDDPACNQEDEGENAFWHHRVSNACDTRERNGNDWLDWRRWTSPVWRYVMPNS
jgi:hypothetical protein